MRDPFTRSNWLSVDRQLYLRGGDTSRSKRGRGNIILEKAALQPRLTLGCGPHSLSPIPLISSFPSTEPFLPGVPFGATGRFLPWLSCSLLAPRSAVGDEDYVWHECLTEFMQPRFLCGNSKPIGS